MQLLPEEGGHGGLRGARVPQELPLLLRAVRRRGRGDRPSQRRLPVLTEHPLTGTASVRGSPLGGAYRALREGNKFSPLLK